LEHSDKWVPRVFAVRATDPRIDGVVLVVEALQ
jgi:hypothetical protein